jgi:membrane-associated protease RseP (regulator of RpoE activity)
MSFIWYDIGLLILFVTFVSFFLYSRRKKIQKEGLLLLYKTPWGIKLINRIGKKYKKTMKALSWLSIISGYFLMAGMLYLIYSIIKIYLFNQDIVRAIKVPPIMPLVPYIDKIVPGLPSFYFFYWILIIIIIAIPHEFAHGIVAAYNKVKIKTTGFGFFPSFLPIFLAAFVELDEKAMSKKSKFGQMATLSAGTFANVVVALALLGLLWITFPLIFSPSGVNFDGYQFAVLNASSILTIEGKQIPSMNYSIMLENAKETGLNEITTSKGTYVFTKELIILEGYSEAINQGYAVVYENSPAIKSGLNGTIIAIDGIKIRSIKNLEEEIMSHIPGDRIVISTLINGSEKDYEIYLEENPENKTEPWIGIAIMETQQKPTAELFSKLTGFRGTHVEYIPRLGDFSDFIYNLLWWATIICFSVALVNMLPAGIFDGGRFFYLTILAITRSEKVAKKAFSFFTYVFLFIVALLMVLWLKSFF